MDRIERVGKLVGAVGFDALSLDWMGNNIVSSAFGGNLPDLGDISNVLGKSIISPGEENRGRSLVDISNVIGRSNSLGEESRGSKNISREESLGEEREKFMGEA